MIFLVHPTLDTSQLFFSSFFFFLCVCVGGGGGLAHLVLNIIPILIQWSQWIKCTDSCEINQIIQQNNAWHSTVHTQVNRKRTHQTNPFIPSRWNMGHTTTRCSAVLEMKQKNKKKPLKTIRKNWNRRKKLSHNNANFQRIHFLCVPWACSTKWSNRCSRSGSTDKVLMNDHPDERPTLLYKTLSLKPFP